MPDADDSKEHSTRRRHALLAGLLGELLAGVFLFKVPEVSYLAPSLWVSCLPFGLAAMALGYWATPIQNHRLGTQAHGLPPRLVRPGNPVLRQSSGAFSLLTGLILASFMGCAVVMGTRQDNDPLLATAVPMMYLSLAILFGIAMSQAHWLELDVDSLRILRHRVTFGLQRSSVHSQQSVRVLAACRTSSHGAYNVFAFSQDGTSLPLSQEKSDVKEIQFEAERLADQLMVPLLVGVEQQSNTSLAHTVRGRADEALPIRCDWAQTASPQGLSAHRSVLPPID